MLCNTVHVIVSGMVFLVLSHGGREAASIPANSLMKSLQYALTTSFGSICYGSLFTAAIRTLRWEVTNHLLLSQIEVNFFIYRDSSFLFFFYQHIVFSFRYVDFDQRLATMSVCFVALIFFSILWRLLFDFLTSMPMFRYASVSMSLTRLLIFI